IVRFGFGYMVRAEIYPLSLHDALPIFRPHGPRAVSAHLQASGHTIRDEGSRRKLPHPARAAPVRRRSRSRRAARSRAAAHWRPRSEEHTSELQSREKLVCRLLLEKKNR